MSIGKIGGYIRASLMTTQGDIISRDANGPIRSSAGSSGWDHIVLSSGTTANLRWTSFTTILKYKLRYDVIPAIGSLLTTTGSGSYDIGAITPGTSGQFLKSNGSGAVPSWDDVPIPDGSVYSPVTYGSQLEAKDTYPAALIKSNGEAYISLCVPSDFDSLEYCSVTGISGADADQTFKIYTDYGTAGEHYQNHQQSDTSITVANDTNDIFFINISYLLTNLAANDIIGIKVVNGSTGDMWVTGAILAYNRS